MFRRITPRYGIRSIPGLAPRYGLSVMSRHTMAFRTTLLHVTTLCSQFFFTFYAPNPTFRDCLLHLVALTMRRWFNDFLHDSDYERALAHARSLAAVGEDGNETASVWSHVHCCRERYTNVLWNGRQVGGGDGDRGGGGGCGGRGRGGIFGDGVVVPEGCDGGGGGGSGGGGGAVAVDEDDNWSNVGASRRGSKSGGNGVRVVDVGVDVGVGVGVGVGVDRRGGVGGGGGGGRGDGEAGVGERETAGDFSKRSTQRDAPLLLRPACGVRSLTVWQRAWASRGLEVREGRGSRRVLVYD